MAQQRTASSPRYWIRCRESREHCPAPPCVLRCRPGVARWIHSFTPTHSAARSRERRVEPDVLVCLRSSAIRDGAAAPHNRRGEHRSRQRAASPDFADYRPYQHGDDVRRIDWNVFGRLGVLQLRQTEAQLRMPILILLDCSASMHWGEPDKLGFARDIALALSRVALARSDSVSITCLGHAQRSMGPLSGIRQFGSVQQFLSNATSAGKIDITAQVQGTLERLGPSRSARRGWLS